MPPHEPLVVRIAREFQRDLRNRQAQQVQAMARRWLMVENRLRQDIIALAAEIARRHAAGEVITLGKLYQIERYQALLAQVQSEIAQYSVYALRAIDAEQRVLAIAGLQDGIAAIQASMFDAWGTIGIEFNRINYSAVEKIVAAARAGQPLNVILERAYPITAQAISDRLVQATALGWSPRKTAQSIINEGLAPGLDHILLVARDQEIRAYREASRESYQEAGVQKYMRISAHDERVCEACIALDGTEYATDELMELHPQDRCAIVPVLPGVDMPEYPTGKDWFDTQTDDMQRSILGPGKYEAYQAGEFEFAQLATPTYSPTWGPGLEVTPLKELTG